MAAARSSSRVITQLGAKSWWRRHNHSQLARRTDTAASYETITLMYSLNISLCSILACRKSSSIRIVLLDFFYLILRRSFSVRRWRSSSQNAWGRCTDSGIGPTWDNPKLRHFYWLLDRLTAIMTNKNDVGPILPTVSAAVRWETFLATTFGCIK